MNPFLILLLSSSVVAPPYSGSKEDGARSIERAQIELQSAREYCSLLLTASRAGRRYSLEQRRSGLARHYQETRIRFLEKGYRILESDKRASKMAFARDDRAERIWWYRLKECFGE